MPRYLLRKWCILRLISDLEFHSPQFIEIGPGSGDFLITLAQHRWSGLGVDISPESVELCMQRLRDEKAEDRITVRRMDFSEVSGKFDILFALEVLEHIEDDKAALRKWAGLVRPGGYLVLSVPARMDKWTAHDYFAGHFRRYERQELIDKVEQAGFEINVLWSYGFPLAELTQRIMGTIAPHREEYRMEMRSRTQRSGLSLTLPPVLRWFINEVTMLPWCWLQAAFFETDMGNGYILRARRRPAAP